MTRMLNIMMVALMLGAIWTLEAMADIPVALNTTIEFDELGRPDHVLLRWDSVGGAVKYEVDWGPKGEPGTSSTAEAQGQHKMLVPVPPGEATTIEVVAYDEDGFEITRSPLDVVLLPKGKAVGTGALEIHGTFQQSTPTGRDQQVTRGSVTFRVFENPALKDGEFEIYGLGKAEWRDVTVSKDGTTSAAASAPVFATGVLRYPSEQEEAQSSVCRLDLTLTEAYKGRVAYAGGAIYGIPIHDFVMDWSIVKKVNGFPLIKGHEMKLAADAAHDVYTVKLTDIAVEAKTGCIGGP